MSEQQSEPTSAEAGSVSASDVRTEPVMTESPTIAPDQELTAPKADAPKIEPKIEPKVEAPKVEAPKPEAPKAEAPKVETKPEAPRPAGNDVIMSPGERMWADDAKASEQAAPKRRLGAMAAVIALAAVAGAIGGAFATAGLGFGNARDVAAAAPRNGELEAAIARIDADILALKAGVEQNAKLGVTHEVRSVDDEAPIVGARLVVTVGGDGTLLAASHLVGGGVPVVGINSSPRSSVGFFCAGKKGREPAILRGARTASAHWIEIYRAALVLRPRPIPPPQPSS